MVPTMALQHNGPQAFVYVVQGRTVALRQVTELASTRQSTGISGVQPGEQVVLTSFDRLQPGAPIRVASIAAASERAHSTERAH